MPLHAPHLTMPGELPEDEVGAMKDANSAAPNGDLGRPTWAIRQPRSGIGCFQNRDPVLAAA